MILSFHVWQVQAIAATVRRVVIASLNCHRRSRLRHHLQRQLCLRFHHCYHQQIHCIKVPYGTNVSRQCSRGPSIEPLCCILGHRHHQSQQRIHHYHSERDGRYSHPENRLHPRQAAINGTICDLLR